MFAQKKKEPAVIVFTTAAGFFPIFGLKTIFSVFSIVFYKLI